MYPYTRLEIEVLANEDYSFKINEEFELKYIGLDEEPVSILFGSASEMKAVAEAMLKMVEYSGNT